MGNFLEELSGIIKKAKLLDHHGKVYRGCSKCLADRGDTGPLGGRQYLLTLFIFEKPPFRRKAVITRKKRSGFKDFASFRHPLLHTSGLL